MFAIGVCLVSVTGCAKASSIEASRPPLSSEPKHVGGSLTVTIRSVGGFRLWGSETSSPAMFYLNDHVQYRPAPVPAIYPGPAVSPVSSAPVTDAQLVALRAKLESLKLLGPAVDLGAATWVADVPDTMIIIVDKTASGTRIYTHQIAALDMEVPPDRPEISVDQIAARKAIAAWVQNPLSETDPAPSPPVAFARFRITAQRQQRANLDTQFEGQEPTWNELAWPLNSPLAGETIECRDIEGEDAVALRSTMKSANQLSYWTSGGEIYQLAVRGLLPGEPNCATAIVPTSVSP
jgi:hypothetical protein